MTSLRLKTAAVIYGVLVVAAIAIGYARGEMNIFLHPEGVLIRHFTTVPQILIGTTAGILLGLGVAGFTRYSVYRYTWAQSLHMEFRAIFGPISGSDVFAFAGISAVAEELFFRGALQPVIGITATSIVFGAVHIAPTRKLMPWTLQALVMGFVLGGLFYVTGDLIAPILAHFTINYQNLHFINRYDPTPELPRALTPSVAPGQATQPFVSRHPR